ncbi:sugar transferase [Novosphingobium sp.]|uniref:sugar transferase n=1 Tax=Novosphingobium sp. TaxID=1874826 RepID=UPI0025D97D67|nr:sugar transferase [Novosphingobium sp.]
MQKLDGGLEYNQAEGAKALIAMPMATDVEAALTVTERPAMVSAVVHEGRRQDVRRLMDIICSIILLVILAPLLLIIALMVAMTSTGPVIFAHKRLGRDGTTFDCLKFRTMRDDAQLTLSCILAGNPGLREQWERDHKLADDPRVTPFGRILRATSLDELPQLVNVLRGDMTLVGPRPIVREELHHYGRYALHYFSVRPGLTGLWQISGRSMTTYRRRVAADVYYVRSRSFLLDTRILLGTLPAVLSAEGSC